MTICGSPYCENEAIAVVENDWMTFACYECLENSDTLEVERKLEE